ncbi:MAG: hypothetical protein ACR2QM_05590, partial [Longimicrobiales bacterium]
RTGSLTKPQQTDLAPLVVEASTRIAVALVLAATLLGSAVFVAADVPPVWRGVSVFGLGGFAASIAMASWLGISILTGRRP